MPGIYPRTITITRPASTLSPNGGMSVGQPSQKGGSVGYLGVNYTTDALVPVMSGISCSIQSKGGSASSTYLPSAAPGPVLWVIFIPRAAAADGQIQTKDRIVDDLGRSFDVQSDYCNLLGYKLECVRLEAGADSRPTA